MTKKLSEYSERELIEWYESFILSEVKKSGVARVPTPAGTQGRLRHDLWNVYAYGDTAKIVYIKNGAKRSADPERHRNRPKSNSAEIPDEATEKERLRQSISRAKARIFEIASCNEFQHFCTFTQDQTKRDRFDLSEFRKDFAQLIRNLNRDRSEIDRIRYLLVPEQHKNGAWHMHGLLSGLIVGEDLRAFDLSERLPNHIKKTIESGTPVYDFARYRRAFGFFTCTEIQDRAACSRYVTKYISKDVSVTARESGEHLFFASQGLKRRDTLLKDCIDKCPVSEWDFENDYVKVKEIPLSEIWDSDFPITKCKKEG